MARRKNLCLGLAILVTTTGFAQAVQGQGHHGGGHHRGGRWGGSGFGGGLGFGGGFAYIYPPVFVMGPGMFLTPPMMMPVGPLMPPPPPGIMPPGLDADVRPARVQNADPARAGQLLIVGDRLLRAGNLKKAEERYLQAMRTAPDLAAPRVRLAQVAIARANYGEAANRLREAETAEPGWVITAPDIQAIFGEPTDFTRQIARLESFLQTHPDDRDAWLVLGAEWFLSGRTAKASDVFKRLNDPARRPDVALAAFLDASNQAAQRPARAPEQAQ
jgi:tetratricopeptide (TPR) repeat protein